MVQNMLSSGISMHGRTCFWKMESFLQCHHKSFLIPYQFIHFKTSITVEIPENREQTADYQGVNLKPSKLFQIPTMIGSHIALFGIMVGVGELLGSLVLGRIISAFGFVYSLF